MLGTGKEEQEEGDESVEEEYLEAESVAKPIIRIEFEEITENWRENGNPGDPTVVDLTFGEKAESVETQQRSVGEARHIEDDANEGVVM